MFMFKKSLIAGSVAMGIATMSGIVLAPVAQAVGTDTLTKTPIKHVVVIFQENVSFDHYFATYPNAKNPAGEPRFTARKDTPTVNGLNEAMLNHNPNSANPMRLGRDEALTCDQWPRAACLQRRPNGQVRGKHKP